MGPARSGSVGVAETYCGGRESTDDLRAEESSQVIFLFEPPSGFEDWVNPRIVRAKELGSVTQQMKKHLPKKRFHQTNL